MQDHRNEIKTEEPESDAIDLSAMLHNFLDALRRLFWIPLALAILLGGLGYWSNRAPGPYTYTSRVVFVVSANYSSATDMLNYSYESYRFSSERLLATFPYILNSDTMTRLIRQDLGVSAINGSVQVSSVSDSGLFLLTATSSTPEDAYALLESVIRVYPQVAPAVLGDTQITIIDSPTLPTAPNETYDIVKPTVYGALIGVCLGLVILLVMSMMRKTVHTAEDLRRLVNLPCMAYLPQVRFKRRRKNSDGHVTILNERVGTDFMESVRMLRVKVMKAMAERGGCKVLLVTSTLPYEGKSTVSANLALSLAADGHRVILIDGDLRNQSLKEALEIGTPSEGLLELLMGKNKQFSLQEVPGTSLLLMAGDQTVSDPQRWLDTRRMGDVMATLRQQLDYIVIDTPPSGILSDAATLAKYADAAIYVVRQDMASTYQIYESIQGLYATGVKLIGAVINGSQQGSTGYVNGSKYDYSYGYASRRTPDEA